MLSLADSNRNRNRKTADHRSMPHRRRRGGHRLQVRVQASNNIVSLLQLLLDICNVFASQSALQQRGYDLDRSVGLTACVNVIGLLFAICGCHDVGLLVWIQSVRCVCCYRTLECGQTLGRATGNSSKTQPRRNLQAWPHVSFACRISSES